MVDFSNKKPRTGFSADGSTAQAPSMKQREKLRLMVLIGVAILFIILLVDFIIAKPELPERPKDAAPIEGLARQPLETMAMPLVKELPAFPSPEEIDDQAELAAQLRADPDQIKLYGLPFQPGTMKWLEQRLADDIAVPPLPMALSGEDLVRGRVRPGKAVLVGGTLVDLTEATVREDEDWLRMVLLLPNPDKLTLFTVVDAPRAALGDLDANELSPGREVHVVGRFLGSSEVSVGDDQLQSTPVIGAYGVHQHDEGAVTQLLNLGAPEERGQVWKSDDSVYDDIQDYPDNARMSHLERRPYYYQLGQVRLDASTPGAYNDPKIIAQWSRDVWQDPAPFRGDVFTVEGTVWEAWEDEQATKDQPFGVDRVVRMWVWKTVFGIGQEAFRDLYEVAVILPRDRELPEAGDVVVLTGRFLKVLTYYQPNSPYMSMLNPEHNDNEYTLFKFFVAPDFTIIPPPPPPDHFWFKLISITVMGSFLIFLVCLIIGENKHADDYKAGLHKLRANRRRLMRERRDGKDDGKDDGSDGDQVAKTAAAPAEDAEDGEGGEDVAKSEASEAESDAQGDQAPSSDEAKPADEDQPSKD